MPRWKAKPTRCAEHCYGFLRNRVRKKLLRSLWNNTYVAGIVCLFGIVWVHWIIRCYRLGSPVPFLQAANRNPLLAQHSGDFRSRIPTQRGNRFRYPLFPHHEVDDDESKCEEYGCPIFPKEYNNIHEEIERIRQINIQSFNSSEFNMAMITHKGHIKTPPINQDVAVLLHPFETAQTPHENDFFMGIFDGHGRLGHRVAGYAAHAIPTILARKFNHFYKKQLGKEGAKRQMNELEIQEALNATFLEADINAPPIAAMDGGTTASVTLRCGGKLYIANAGDSRTIVVSVLSETDLELAFMTRFDKAHLPEEKSRIERMGGKVVVPGNRTALSRVYEYSTTSRETVGLAMSRSIGDWEFGAVGVTAEPLISVLKVDSLVNAFVLAASDGMWDTRDPRFFANHFATSLSRRLQHPLTTCVDIIDKISPKNEDFYRDDITMIAMKILDSSV